VQERLLSEHGKLRVYIPYTQKFGGSAMLGM
jgi:hypothetical protein